MVGLVALVAAMVLYMWTVLSENSLLKKEFDQVRGEGGQLKHARDQFQRELEESTMILNDKKHYISEIDGKFLRVNADLEKKVTELQQCIGQKTKISAEAEKQKNDLKAKDDRQKTLEGEKKNVENVLEEFKKLCASNNTGDMLKKLCPK
ncbi:uncharacterized protein LOC144612382 [Rhinoraja longicauda]